MMGPPISQGRGYAPPLDETASEKITRLNNREMIMKDAAGQFTPDYNTPSDPYRSMNYMSIADTASALGIPMPEPVAGPGAMYGQQQAADFVAANPVPNRLGVQAMSPQDAMAMRQRQLQGMRPIPGSAPIMPARSFSPQNIPQSSEPGIMNSLARMFGY